VIARRQLLKKLELIKPALAAETNNISALWSYWFTGSHVLAWNGRIAISTPRTTTFIGGLPGALLIDLLRRTDAPAVDIVADGDKAQLTLGSSTVRLPMLPAEDFEQIFAMPDMPKTNLLIGIAGRFFAAIEHCLRGVSPFSTIAEHLGVTVIPNGRSVSLFSTDRETISHAELPLANGTGLKQRRRVTLNVEFCEQMLRLAKQAQTVRLAVRRDYALFAADDTLLFGRLWAVDRPTDYAGTWQHYVSPSRVQAMVDIPAALRPMLARAAKITTGIGERSVISIRDGVARFHTVGNFESEVTDSIALPGHPDVDLEIDTERLNAGAARLDKVLFTAESVLMRKDDRLYLISAQRG
jgi:hypothetical protein